MLKKRELYKNEIIIFKKQFQASKCLTFSKDEKRLSKLFLKIERTYKYKPVIAFGVNLIPQHTGNTRDLLNKYK